MTTPVVANHVSVDNDTAGVRSTRASARASTVATTTAMNGADALVRCPAAWPPTS